MRGRPRILAPYSKGRSLDDLAKLKGERLAAAPTYQVYTCIYQGVEMPVARSRTFRSGNSEAIRLPRDVAFGRDVELVIVRSGDVMTIYPAAMSIPAMIKRLRSLPAPPTIERRDDEELPERARL
jgi:antitoxin VapB